MITDYLPLSDTDAKVLSVACKWEMSGQKGESVISFHKRKMTGQTKPRQPNLGSEEFEGFEKK